MNFESSAQPAIINSQSSEADHLSRKSHSNGLDSLDPHDPEFESTIYHRPSPTFQSAYESSLDVDRVIESVVNGTASVTVTLSVETNVNRSITVSVNTRVNQVSSKRVSAHSASVSTSVSSSDRQSRENLRILEQVRRQLELLKNQPHPQVPASFESQPPSCLPFTNVVHHRPPLNPFDPASIRQQLLQPPRQSFDPSVRPHLQHPRHQRPIPQPRPLLPYPERPPEGLRPILPSLHPQRPICLLSAPLQDRQRAFLPPPLQSLQRTSLRQYPPPLQRFPGDRLPPPPPLQHLQRLPTLSSIPTAEAAAATPAVQQQPQPTFPGYIPIERPLFYTGWTKPRTERAKRLRAQRYKEQRERCPSGTCNTGSQAKDSKLRQCKSPKRFKCSKCCWSTQFHKTFVRHCRDSHGHVILFSCLYCADRFADLASKKNHETTIHSLNRFRATKGKRKRNETETNNNNNNKKVVTKANELSGSRSAQPVALPLAGQAGQVIVIDSDEETNDKQSDKPQNEQFSLPTPTTRPDKSDYARNWVSTGPVSALTSSRTETVTVPTNTDNQVDNIVSKSLSDTVDSSVRSSRDHQLSSISSQQQTSQLANQQVSSTDRPTVTEESSGFRESMQKQFPVDIEKLIDGQLRQEYSKSEDQAVNPESITSWARNNSTKVVNSQRYPRVSAGIYSSIVSENIHLQENLQPGFVEPDFAEPFQPSQPISVPPSQPISVPPSQPISVPSTRPEPVVSSQPVSVPASKTGVKPYHRATTFELVKPNWKFQPAISEDIQNHYLPFVYPADGRVQAFGLADCYLGSPQSLDESRYHFVELPVANPESPGQATLVRTDLCRFRAKEVVNTGQILSSVRLHSEFFTKDLNQEGKLIKTFEETILHDFEDPSTCVEQIHFVLFDQRENRLCRLEVGVVNSTKEKLWEDTSERFAFERRLRPGWKAPV